MQGGQIYNFRCKYLIRQCSVGSCHHDIAHPPVADTRDMEGSCEYY
jgi:hypothetical protein